MSDPRNLTVYPDQRDELFGMPVYNDNGQLVCVINVNHPMAAEVAERITAQTVSDALALTLARKVLGKGASDISVRLAASLIREDAQKARAA